MRSAPAERGLPALQAIKVGFQKVFCHWFQQQQHEGGMSDVQTWHVKPRGTSEAEKILKVVQGALWMLLLSPSGGLLGTWRLCMG